MKVKEQQLCSWSGGPGVLCSKRVVGAVGDDRTMDLQEGGTYRVYYIPEILKKFGNKVMSGDSKKCNLKLQV